MQRRALIVVGVVVVASLVGAVGTGAAQSDEDFVTLTIEVVTSSNQNPGGVTLVATWDDGETTVTTAANGMALVDVPQGATVEITVDDDEYTRNEPYRIRVATERSHTIDIARQADLDVVVTDAEGPVADALVTLRQDGAVVADGRTDDEGRFSSGTIAQGRYNVSVFKTRYYRTNTSVLVAGSPERTVSIERGRVDYDFLVEDTHFDPAQPVSDATVEVQGVGDLVTDSRGTATPLLPVNSDVEVTVSKEGYESTTRTIAVDESAGSASFAISREPSLSLTTLNRQIVVGEVVSVEVTNAYDEPAANAAILVDGEPAVQTDADGEATVTIESTGEHDLQARRGGTTSNTVTVTGVSADDEATEMSTTSVTETTSAEGPGFGPAAAFVALCSLAFVLVADRRGRRRR
jgi:hypothetical protein